MKNFLLSWFILFCIIFSSTLVILASISLNQQNKHKYKVSDCYTLNKEDWEDNFICKIKRVGKSHYLTSCPIVEGLFFPTFEEKTESIKEIDSSTHLIDCPKDI